MSITVTIEELYQEHLSGKSIEQLSKETGMSKWALYKAFQRLKYRQQQVRENVQMIEGKQNILATHRKPNRVKQFFEALAVFGSIVAIYFIYLEIKKKGNKPEN